MRRGRHVGMWRAAFLFLIVLPTPWALSQSSRSNFAAKLGPGPETESTKGRSRKAGIGEACVIEEECSRDLTCGEDGKCKAFECSAPEVGCYHFDQHRKNNGMCLCNPKCMESEDCCPSYRELCVRAGEGKPGKRFTWQQLLCFWALATALFSMTAFVSWKCFGAPMPLTFDIVQLMGLTSMGPLDWTDSKWSSIEYPRWTEPRSWFRMRFVEPKLEEMWDAWASGRNITGGCYTLFWSTVIIIIGKAMTCLAELTNKPCDGFDFHERLVPWAIQFLALMSLLSGSIACNFAPTYPVYWTMVVFCYFYIPASFLPPFALSCRELKKCNGSDSWIVVSARDSVDCSLKGITAMMMLMTWILVQPWIISNYKYVHGIHVWMVSVVFGWSWLYDWMSGEQVFDKRETGYAMLLLFLTAHISARTTFKIEKIKRKRFVEDLEQRRKGRMIYAYLEFMMPQHVIPTMILDPRAPIAEEVECGSVLFVVISDFAKVTQNMTPLKLLEFLNETFTKLDEICACRAVTKIETVAEEYVACVGVLPDDIRDNREKGHTHLLERLVDAADAILRLGAGRQDLQFKMGIQTGRVVAGVIGTKLPRYRLFGDTVNSAARMMQKGLNGKLQFGDETYRHLPKVLKDYVEHRGHIEMKGKGAVNTYLYSPPDLSAPPRQLDLGRLGKLAARRKDAKRKTLTAKLVDDVAAYHGETRDDAPEKGGDSEGDATGGDSAGGDAIVKGDDIVKVKLTKPRKRRKKKEKRESERDERVTSSVSDGTSQRFEEALECMSTQESASSHSWSHSLSPKQEEEWFYEFVQNGFCRKSSQRFGMAALLLMALSGMELNYAMNNEIWIYRHALYSKRWRWLFFVLTRFVSILLTMIWWYVADASTWLQDNIWIAQRSLLVYIWLTVGLVYMSYDALTFSTEGTYKKITKEAFRAPSDIWLSCNFILVYYATIRMFQLSWRTVIFFVPLTIALITCHYWVEHFSAHASDPQNPVHWMCFIPVQGQFLLVADTIMNVAVAREDEITSRARFKVRHTIRETGSRIDYILHTLMPPMVVDRIRQDQTSFASSHAYRHATVAQSDLCGFTKMAADRTPSEVVQFMGELFGRFDELTDTYGVYKVETIGDAYIAGMAEPPLTPLNSPSDVVLFGLAIVRVVDEWAHNLGVDVACRVGIHYGECIGGIVGNHMQRYHLFGEFLSCLEILESTSLAGRVQLSRACKDEVIRQLTDEPWAAREERLYFRPRNEPWLETSKGEIHEYEEVGGITFLTESSSMPLIRVLTGRLA